MSSSSCACSNRADKNSNGTWKRTSPNTAPAIISPGGWKYLQNTMRRKGGRNFRGNNFLLEKHMMKQRKQFIYFPNKYIKMYTNTYLAV